MTATAPISPSLSTLAELFLRPALPPLVIGLITLAAIALATLAYRRSEASAWARRSLLAMRILSVLAIATLLLGPSHLPPTVERDVKPGVTLLIDVSESMATGDCAGRSRIDAVRDRWLGDASLDRIAAVAELDLRLVGSVSEPIGRATVADMTADAARAGASNLLEALRSVIDESGANDGGRRVLLLSDGRDTSGASPTPILELAKARRIAIDTLCVGAAVQRRDLSVHAAPLQDFLYTDESGGLLLRLQQVGLPLDAIEIEIAVNGPEGPSTTRHPVDLRGRTMAELEVPIRHAKPGQYEYLVRVAERPEELDGSNNVQTLFVDVSKAKARVLMLEGLPSWDMKFVAQALRKDPRVELVQISRLSEKRTEVILSGDRSGTKRDLPTVLSTDAIGRYDVFVLGTGLERVITPEIAASIRDAVVERGAGVVFVRGLAYAPDADSHAAAFAPIEPVDFDRGADARLQGMRVGLTASAATMPWLSRERLGVDLVAEADRLPLWPQVRRIAGLRPASVVLARAAEAGAPAGFADDESAPPAIVSMRIGRGTSLAILGEGMWKWALVDRDRDAFSGMYERCWQGLLRWVAAGGEAQPGQDVTLRLSRQDVALGLPVTVEAVLDHRVERPPTAVTVRRPDGSEERLPLAAGSDGGLRLTSGFRPERAGVHVVTLEAPGLEPPTQQRYLHVFDPSVERVNTSADPALMTLLAERTGGRSFAMEEAGSYPEHVRMRRFSTIASQEAEWVWNRFPFLLMLCMWLGIEWILRRRAGLP